MSRLSKTKVKDLVLDYLKRKAGLTVKTIASGNGYFLFEFGKNSVFHFTFKEIRGWKFGLWLRWEDDEKKKLKIDFFGHKINWIDKFKPTQTMLANSVVISSYKDLDDFELMYDLFYSSNEHYDSDGDILKWLLLLKRYRHLTEYFMSSNYSNKSFTSWLMDEIWFYDIEKPITDFYEAHIQGLLYKAALWLVGLKYHKYVKTRPVIDLTEPGWMTSPRYETGVEYRPGLPEETVKKIWYKIEDSRLVKFMRGNSHFNQYSDSEAKRGFYYPEYYEEKQKKEEAERADRLEKLKNKNNK
jgi:hypothetical protein